MHLHHFSAKLFMPVKWNSYICPSSQAFTTDFILWLFG